jgi:hypothetical protein
MPSTPYEEFPPLTEESKAVLCSNCDLIGNSIITTPEVREVRRFLSAAFREAMQQCYTGAITAEQVVAWQQLSAIADNIHNIHPTPSQMHLLLQEMIDGDAAISVNNSVVQNKLRTLQRGLAHHLPA